MKSLTNFDELSAAIAKGDEDRIAMEIRSGLTVNGTDVLGRTLLMVAAAEGNLQIVQHLIEAGAKLDVRDRLNFHDGGGKTALHRAAEQGHLDIVKALCTAGAKLDVIDKSKYTPLALAVANNDLAISSYLLAAGANPNGSERRPTPLSGAAVAGFTEIVAVLLKYGANPDHPSDSLSPALHYAAFAGWVEITRMLIDAGARVDAVDQDGKTILDRMSVKIESIDVTLPKPGSKEADELMRAIKNRQEILAMLRKAVAGQIATK